MKTDEQAQPIVTKNGEKLEEVGNGPFWLDFKTKERIPISSFSDKELLERVKEVEERQNSHRAEILSRQRAIVKLHEVKNDLAREMQKRDIPNLLLPELEFTK